MRLQGSPCPDLASSGRDPAGGPKRPTDGARADQVAEHVERLGDDAQIEDGRGIAHVLELSRAL